MVFTTDRYPILIMSFSLNKVARKLGNCESSLHPQSSSQIVRRLGQGDAVSVLDLAFGWITKRMKRSIVEPAGGHIEQDGECRRPHCVTTKGASA